MVEKVKNRASGLAIHIEKDYPEYIVQTRFVRLAQPYRIADWIYA